MRRSLQGREFGSRTLVFTLMIAGCAAFAVGCQDARISVREFLAMQERLEREEAAKRSLKAPAPSRPVSQPVYCPAPQSAEPPSESVEPPSHSPTPMPTSIQEPEPAGDENSAIRDNGVVQVRADEQAESWFFDPKRGEWVTVKLPRKPRKTTQHVQRASLHEPRSDSFEYSTLNDTAPLADELADSVATADQSSVRYSVPARANMPASTEPLMPLDQLLQLAKRPYQLGPEDLLMVTLTGLTGIDTLAEPAGVEVRVAHDGTINLPLIGSVRVGDMDIISAETTIRKLYVPKFVPTLAVGIRVEQFKTTDVVVVGAAQLPGLVKLKRNERTVLHAVAEAGGMTQDASGAVVVQKLRDPENKLHVFLRNSADLQSVLAMDPLESGDVIEVVAAQPNTIFVGGLVNLPGPREFPPGTEVTALQALASAGGPVEAVFPNDATLIRRMPNGEDVHVRIDIEKLRSGEDPNLKLQPGDIFWVPETFGTRFMAFLNQSLFIRAGATVSYNVTGIEFLNRPRQQVGNVGSNNVRNSVDPLGFLVP